MTVQPPAGAGSLLLSLLQPWAVEEPIQRRLMVLSDAQPGQAVLWVGWGTSDAVLWWASRLGTRVEAVHPDPPSVERADAAARVRDLSALATFQAGDPTSLPHEDAVFDLTLVNLLQLPGVNGVQVLREAARVSRPLAPLITVAPAWLGAPDESDRHAVGRVGLAPRRVIEWKDALRAAGVVELEVEDAALDGRWLAGGRLALLARGWREHGWAGVRAAFDPTVPRLLRLAQVRTLGLVIIKGNRWRS